MSGRPKVQPYPGMVVGNGTFIRRAETTSRRGQRWTVRCKCGAERDLPLACAMRGGVCRKCQPESTRKHGCRGVYQTPEYQAWCHVRDRCYNLKSISYPNYGGRGIIMCKRWNSFPAFLEDMGQRPSDKHSLDRIDNDGNYEPGNCRWATSYEQSRNRRGVVVSLDMLRRILEMREAGMFISQIARELGIKPSTVSFNVSKLRKSDKLRALLDGAK